MTTIITLTKEDIKTCIVGNHFEIRPNKHLSINFTRDALFELMCDFVKWEAQKKASESLNTKAEFNNGISKKICGCGGELTWDGMTRLSNPPKYAHTCDKCNKIHYESAIL